MACDSAMDGRCALRSYGATAFCVLGFKILQGTGFVFSMNEPKQMKESAGLHLRVIAQGEIEEIYRKAAGAYCTCKAQAKRINRCVQGK